MTCRACGTPTVPAARFCFHCGAALPEPCRLSEPQPGCYLVEGRIDPQVVATVTSWCAARSVMPRDLAIGRRTLEQAVLALTGDGAWAGSAQAPSEPLVGQR